MEETAAFCYNKGIRKQNRLGGFYMIRSSKERLLWAQFDALQLGSGWDEEDIEKPQILVEDVFGDSHPGSVHLNQVSGQVAYGICQLPTT